MPASFMPFVTVPGVGVSSMVGACVLPVLSRVLDWA